MFFAQILPSFKKFCKKMKKRFPKIKNNILDGLLEYVWEEVCNAVDP